MKGDQAALNRISKLSETCKNDEVEYIKHPKVPFLKSCLDYKKALASGIEDRRSLDECSDDMEKEIDSCRELKRENDDFQERLRFREEMDQKFP